MPKRKADTLAPIPKALVAKVETSRRKTAHGPASRNAIADNLADLREESRAAGQFNAAVQAERIRSQILGADKEIDRQANDLAALSDSELWARLDAAQAELRETMPRKPAQGNEDKPENADNSMS